MNLFLFRRDLRIFDNNGLNYLINIDEPIVLAFIFDPIQIDKDNNPYFSNNNVQFLYESLSQLSKQININFYYELKVVLLNHSVKLHALQDCAGRFFELAILSSEPDPPKTRLI